MLCVVRIGSGEAQSGVVTILPLISLNPLPPLCLFNWIRRIVWNAITLNDAKLFTVFSLY